MQEEVRQMGGWKGGQDPVRALASRGETLGRTEPRALSVRRACLATGSHVAADMGA